MIETRSETTSAWVQGTGASLSTKRNCSGRERVRMIPIVASIRVATLSAASIVLALVVAACGSVSSSDSGRSGKTLVIEKSFDLVSGDPGRTIEITGSMVMHSIYEPLLTFSGSDLSKPVPLVAKSYDLSSDARMLTLQLHDDVKFSDGTNLTAADVIFTFNRGKNRKAPSAFIMEGLTVSAPDDHTVVVKSDKPNPALPVLMTVPALGIENEKVFREHGGTDDANASTTDKALSWLNGNSAGSGPYELQSFSTTAQVVLIASPHYWGGQEPANAKIVMRNTTPEVQKLDVQKGQTQVALDLSPQQAMDLDGSLNVIRNPSTNIWFVFTNENPAISTITPNKDFQQAVRLGLDYKSLVDLAGEGSIQAQGIIPTQLSGALGESRAPQFDAAAARAALMSSGYSGQAIEMEYPSDLSENGIDFNVVAQRVKDELQSIGINITLKPTPLAVALQNYRDGKEQMGLWLYTPDYPDPSEYLAFLPGGHVAVRAGWVTGSDSPLEALGSRAATVADPAGRVNTYEQIQEQLNQRGPFMQFLESAQIAVTAKSVSGFQYNPIWTVELSTLK